MTPQAVFGRHTYYRSTNMQYVLLYIVTSLIVTQPFQKVHDSLEGEAEQGSPGIGTFPPTPTHTKATFYS